MIKLVACRLERLLLDSQGRLQISALQQRLTEMKIHHAQLVLLSRFSYPYLLNRFQALSGPLDYVAENGAEVLINGVNVKERMLDAVLLSQLLDWLGQKDEFREAIVTVSSRTHTITNAKADSPSFNTLHRYYPNVQSVPDLLMVASNVYQIRIDIPQGRTYLHRMLIEEHFPQRFRIVNGGPHWFYLVVPEANFATGLAVIQKHLKIRNRQTAAFGKLKTDFDYLNLAKYSFTPQDADPSVKDISHPLNGDHQSDIMKQIDRLMKQK